ncbi:MAG: YqaJ viral recombinase family protein [Proteobacteria bacterium]|nr:YqaJ viral recombinase family protein [Pseudomonadota bacterium]
MTEELIQGSPEWFAARCGKVTASRVADVVAETKSGWGASRGYYMAELIAERMTGATAASFSNAAMQWGTDTEPQARAAYEFFTDAEVKEIGFVVHPDIKEAGASPDGFVGKDGEVQIKCPNTATHIDTLLTGKIPKKYITQMQWGLACSGRDWCDFVSFDPRMPANLQLFVNRVERDEGRIKDLEELVIGFIGELDNKVAALEALAGDDEVNPTGATNSPPAPMLDDPDKSAPLF